MEPSDDFAGTEAQGELTFGDGEDMEAVLNQFMDENGGMDGEEGTGGDASSLLGEEEAELTAAAAARDGSSLSTFDMPKGDEQDDDNSNSNSNNYGNGDGDDADQEGSGREEFDGEGDREEEEEEEAREEEAAEQNDEELSLLPDLGEGEADGEGDERAGDIEGGEEDMDLEKPAGTGEGDEEDEHKNENENENENDDDREEESAELLQEGEGGEGGEATEEKAEDGEDGEEAEEHEPREELPKVRKWTKKWVSVGHLKLYKWVPLDGHMPKKQPVLILQPVGKGSKKDQKELARTQRLLNDNAPITRSVTAAFKEKHQKELQQRNKRDSRRKSHAPSPSRSTRSSSRLRNKENKEIFSKISEDNIITPQRLSDEARGQKRKATNDLAPEGADAVGGPAQATDASANVLPLGGSGLITNDLPMALPVPVSLSSTAADTAASAKERRLY